MYSACAYKFVIDWKKVITLRHMCYLYSECARHIFDVSMTSNWAATCESNDTDQTNHFNGVGIVRHTEQYAYCQVYVKHWIRKAILLSLQ